jgi:hypothetical protein
VITWLGNSENAVPFKGEKLAMAVTELRYAPAAATGPGAVGVVSGGVVSGGVGGVQWSRGQVLCHRLPSPPEHFTKLLDTEARFYNARHPGGGGGGISSSGESSIGKSGGAAAGTAPGAGAAPTPSYSKGREGGTPRPYETGECAFDGVSFRVTPAVMLPRAGSELLVARALEHLAGSKVGDAFLHRFPLGLSGFLGVWYWQ